MDILFTFFLTFFSLVIILLCCEVFTNSVEWLGKKLNLSHGAVGSILAAIGTALPETLLPVIAVFSASNADAGHQIGVGTIIGAPLMLSTLALFICGFSVAYFARKKIRSPLISIDSAHMKRDFSFFIGAFLVAVFASFLPAFWMKGIAAIILVLIYVAYFFKTLRHPGEIDEDLSPLYIARRHASPSLFLVCAQIVLALIGIIIGAKLFVAQVETLSTFFHISTLILALLIAPIATELPEKFNSVLWMKARKDTLALGNISGALVFQASVVPVIGIFLTPWVLGSAEMLSVTLTLVAAALFYLLFRATDRISPYFFMGIGGTGYALFVAAVIFLPQMFNAATH